MIGTSLAHYQITGKLGAGGMGEVYRATDRKLGREVAIKVLPEKLTHKKARLSRFEREARVLATLNHKNIAQIYGFDQDGDTHFLVMELAEGGKREKGDSSHFFLGVPSNLVRLLRKHGDL